MKLALMREGTKMIIRRLTRYQMVRMSVVLMISFKQPQLRPELWEEVPSSRSHITIIASQYVLWSANISLLLAHILRRS